MSFTYEQYDVLHNFISPITGRVLSDPNYVLVGNKNGIAIPSPILIDIRLDLIALRKRYNSLVKGDIIIGHPNNELPNAQVLFNLANGYLYNIEGVVSINTLIPIGDLPDLPYKNIWIGDNTNRPVPQQRVALDNLPSFRTLNPFNNFGIYGLYTGQFLSLTSPLDIAQPTTTQRIDMSNMPHLSKGKMWIGQLNYLPPVIRPIPTFPYVEVVGSLNWSAPGIPPGDGDAVPTEIGLNAGEIFTGNPNNSGQIIVSNVLSPLLGGLPYKYIWRGDVNGKPVAVTDLILLENRVSSIESTIVAMQASIGQLGVQIGALQLQVGALDTALGLLTIEVQAIAATVATMSATVLALGLTVGALGVSVTALESQVNSLSNRTLDQIPVARADVNLNGHKIVNLADATNSLDAVNLQTMQAAISAATGGLISSVTGTVNQITANTVAGAVNLSLPSDVIISTSLTVGNLELIGNTLQSNNTNGNIILNPNGTGNVDVNNHRIINVGNAVGAQDAVNLQTLNAAISGILIVGTTNQITVNTVSSISTISLPASVIISTSLTAGNMQLTGNSLVSTNTNGNITLNPNGTGNVDVNNHKIINLANPVNPLDAVNLQTLNAAIGTGGISSVSGTTNQITATTVSGAVTLSLPSAVIISTSLQAGNMQLTGNSLISTNTNGSISITPNGSGNLLLIPSPSTGNVGIKGTPSYPLDVFGAMRTQRIIGSTAATATAGVASVTGTGSTITIFGSELGGIVDLNTGTGITTAGTTNPIITVTFTSAMPSTNYAIVLSAGNLGASSLPVYAIGTTSTSFTIRCSTVLANSTSYTFHYHVIGN